MTRFIDGVVNGLIATACIVVIALGILDVRGRSTTGPESRRKSAIESIDRVVFDLEGTAVLLPPSATAALVEVSDYQCPFCGQYARETFSQVQREFVEPGKIAYIFLDYPIERIHPLAFKAAEAAECAGEQGMYWQMHERLFQEQKNLTEPDLREHAATVGLDSDRFRQCIDEGRAALVRDRMRRASELGVRSTPTFFAGRIEGGKLTLIRRLKGALPFAAFKSTLDEMLSAPRTLTMGFASQGRVTR